MMNVDKILAHVSVNILKIHPAYLALVITIIVNTFSTSQRIAFIGSYRYFIGFSLLI